jgi:hypothetical protein
MKSQSIHLTLALLASAAATAQEPKEHRPPPIPPLLAIFDTDRDAVLSAAEIQAASEALGKLDRNSDGKITRDEMHPPRPEGEGNPPPVNPPGPPHGRFRLPPVIVALDADKNGRVSAEELADAPESLKQLDNNGDGELTFDELLPQGPPPPPAGEQGEEGPPPGRPAAGEGGRAKKPRPNGPTNPMPNRGR